MYTVLSSFIIVPNTTASADTHGYTNLTAQNTTHLRRSLKQYGQFGPLEHNWQDLSRGPLHILTY